MAPHLPVFTIPSRLKGPCSRRKKPLRPEASRGWEQGKARVRVLATPIIPLPWSLSNLSSTFPSSSSPSPAHISLPHSEPGPDPLCALSHPLTILSSRTPGSNVAFDSALRLPPHPQVSSLTLPELCMAPSFLHTSPPSTPHLFILPSSVIISPSCLFRFLFYFLLFWSTFLPYLQPPWSPASPSSLSLHLPECTSLPSPCPVSSQSSSPPTS